MLPSGIYEQVINRLISSELNCDENIIKTESINSEEAAKILAQYFNKEFLKITIIILFIVCFITYLF